VNYPTRSTASGCAKSARRCPDLDHEYFDLELHAGRDDDHPTDLGRHVHLGHAPLLGE
jgi:hypothetical protein